GSDGFFDFAHRVMLPNPSIIVDGYCSIIVVAVKVLPVIRERGVCCELPRVNEDWAETRASLMKALGDPTRLTMVASLWRAACPRWSEAAVPAPARHLRHHRPQQQPPPQPRPHRQARPHPAPRHHQLPQPLSTAWAPSPQATTW